MKILICTDTYLPGVGGTEQACWAYANALAEVGHEVVLACPSYGKLKRDDAHQKFDIVRLPSLKLTDNDFAVLANLQIGKLKKKLREKNFVPDIIHAETVSGMAKIALRLGKMWNVPVVMTVHTKFREAFARRAGRLISSIMVKALVRKLKRADKVISVVENMKQELVEYGFNGDVEIIKNGAVLEKYAPSSLEKENLREKLGFGANEKIMLFVGLMVTYKRVDFVLQAFKKAVDKGLDAKFIFVGGGVDLENFKKLSEELGLKDRVTFTDRIRDRETIVLYYQISDLFVIASIFDNDPIVVVEAACSKVPSLVVENTGCSGRIVDGFNGFTAKNNEEDFSDKMLEIFSKDFSDVAQNAFDTVPSTWAQTVALHEPIYENLIKQASQKELKKQKSTKSKKTLALHKNQ